jgi:hypothetical protein
VGQGTLKMATEIGHIKTDNKDISITKYFGGEDGTCLQITIMESLDDKLNVAYIGLTREQTMKFIAMVATAYSKM